MKTIFYKIKHFWKEGKSATWLKSSQIDEKLFSGLKQQYEDIKYSQEKYIIIEDKTLFLFYETKKDFHNRPITEITALVSDKKIKNSDTAYNILKQNISNIFDDTLEYTIEVADSNIEKKLNKSIFVILSGVLVSSFIYFYFNNDIEKNEPTVLTNMQIAANQNNTLSKKLKTKSIDKNNSKIIINKKDNNLSEKTIKLKKKEKDIPKLIKNKQQQVKKSWRWTKFCKNHKYSGQDYCYEEFIKDKCRKKEKNDKNYIEYIKSGKNHLCIELKDMDIDKISDDDQLKSKKYLKKKKFFKDKK